MDSKLWEYIFEMFNYKIRQKEIDFFFKITNPYPALKRVFLKTTFFKLAGKSIWKTICLNNFYLQKTKS